jgi:hypothetical protein
MASMVTTVPLSSSALNSLGMAVISLDFHLLYAAQAPSVVSLPVGVPGSAQLADPPVRQNTSGDSPFPFSAFSPLCIYLSMDIYMYMRRPWDPDTLPRASL